MERNEERKENIGYKHQKILRKEFKKKGKQWNEQKKWENIVKD